MSDYHESELDSSTPPFWPTLLPKFGVLAILNIIAAPLGRLVQGRSEWFLYPIFIVIEIVPVAYLAYVALVAVKVVVAPVAAHPIDRWLCRHSGVISLVLGIVPVSILVLMFRTHDDFPAWNIVQVQLVQLALEINLTLAVTCLIPFYSDGHVPRGERWKLANLPVLLLDLMLIVLIPIATFLAAMEGRTP